MRNRENGYELIWMVSGRNGEMLLGASCGAMLLIGGAEENDMRRSGKYTG